MPNHSSTGPTSSRGVGGDAAEGSATASHAAACDCRWRSASRSASIAAVASRSSADPSRAYASSRSTIARADARRRDQRRYQRNRSSVSPVVAAAPRSNSSTRLFARTPARASGASGAGPERTLISAAGGPAIVHKVCATGSLPGEGASKRSQPPGRTPWAFPVNSTSTGWGKAPKLNGTRQVLVPVGSGATEIPPTETWIN